MEECLVAESAMSPGEAAVNTEPVCFDTPTDDSVKTVVVDPSAQRVMVPPGVEVVRMPTPPRASSQPAAATADALSTGLPDVPVEWAPRAELESDEPDSGPAALPNVPTSLPQLTNNNSSSSGRRRRGGGRLAAGGGGGLTNGEDSGDSQLAFDVEEANDSSAGSEQGDGGGGGGDRGGVLADDSDEAGEDHLDSSNMATLPMSGCAKKRANGAVATGRGAPEAGAAAGARDETRVRFTACDGRDGAVTLGVDNLAKWDAVKSGDKQRRGKVSRRVAAVASDLLCCWM